MRSPLSYVPLLPLAAILVIAIVIIDLFKTVPTESPMGETYKGIVTDRRETNIGQQLTVACRDTASHFFNCRLTVPTTVPEYGLGDSIIFSGALKVPTLRNPQENDYPKRLRALGISYTGYIDIDSIRSVGRCDNLYWKIRRLQPLLGNLIKRSSLSDDAIEFLTATLTGDTSIIEPDTRAMFSSAGLAHILALSGLHAGILAVVMSIALFPLTMLGRRKLRIALTLILLWGYVVLTGFSPSVTRAVIMATTLGVGILIGRRNISFNSLLLAAIIILLADPKSLFQAGFQLSFCAVAAILLFIPLIPTAERMNSVVRYLLSIVIVTVAATLGTGIISAYHFHTFPLYFILANIPVLALLPVLMGGGILILICEAFGYDPVLLCDAVNALLSVIYKITSLIATLPHATLDKLYFTGWIAVPYFATLAALIFFLLKPSAKRALAPAAGLAVTVCALVVLGNKTYPPEEFFITRATYETSAIYRNGNTALLFTTASEGKRASIAANYHDKFSDYLDSHGVDTLIVASDTVSSDKFRRNGNKISFNGTNYHFISTNDIENSDETTDYVIVCRGFSGDIMTIARRLQPDTILLSSDLHPRRHNRYIDSLVKHQIPHRSLKVTYHNQI